MTDAGHGNRLLWTHTTDSANTENYGLWNLDFEDGSLYLLEVHTDGGTYAESQQAAYVIRHAAGNETTVVIDQSAVDGFQPLGELEFDAGAGQWIRFNDNTGEPLSTETRLAFDALRITPVSEDPEDPQDPEDPGSPVDSPTAFGGCHAGGGLPDASLALLLLAGIGLSVRRRRR